MSRYKLEILILLLFFQFMGCQAPQYFPCIKPNFSYDSKGILYFSNGNSIYKYKDNDISKVFDISSGDKFTIDQNNIIRIYNSEGCYKEESLKTSGESSLKADQQQQVVTQSKTSLEEDSKSYSISYSANVEGDGWQEVKNNGQTAGTTGESKRIEAIKIQGDDIPQGAVIKYRTHL